MHDITLRIAEEKDCALIFEWRNAPQIRMKSTDAKELTFVEHQAWFTKTLSSDNAHILIAQGADATAMGVIRFNVEGDIATVSLFLNPIYIGQGYGAILLKKGEAWVRYNLKQVAVIEAKILSENERSYNLFLKTDYVEYMHIVRKRITHE